jgi:hypothetical protein
MQLVLTRNYSFSSAMIRARMSFSKKRLEHWSHAILLLDDGITCIDSTFKLGGVRERPFAEAIHASRDWQIKRMPLVLPKPDAALGRAKALVGRPYDLRNVFGWAVGSRDWDDSGSEYCFEFLALVIEAGSEYRFPSHQRVSGYDLQQAAEHLVSVYGRV